MLCLQITVLCERLNIMIKILLGGSPCTFWSIAQKNNRETEAEGLGWELFKNYLIAKQKFKPDFFLYENNKSAAKAIKDQISRELGVELMYINSALVSAQNRQRFYAFNWVVDQPADRGVTLQSILEYGEANREKSKTVRVGGSGSGWGDKHEWDMPNPERRYTITELERLQTMPDGYTEGISVAQRKKCLGNGWTAEVIIHILQGALKDVPKDEEIVVLSMYDGIGTGRYCLDKMGFTNVKYFAHEIDKYAKEIALNNYPDIIQMGDAFELRHPDWTIGY